MGQMATHEIKSRACDELHKEQRWGRSWKKAAWVEMEKWPDDHLNGSEAKKEELFNQRNERGTEMELWLWRGMSWA